jgi:hypothetical protein
VRPVARTFSLALEHFTVRSTFADLYASNFSEKVCLFALRDFFPAITNRCQKNIQRNAQALQGHGLHKHCKNTLAAEQCLFATNAPAVGAAPTAGAAAAMVSTSSHCLVTSTNRPAESGIMGKQSSLWKKRTTSCLFSPRSAMSAAKMLLSRITPIAAALSSSCSEV